MSDRTNGASDDAADKDVEFEPILPDDEGKTAAADDEPGHEPDEDDDDDGHDERLEADQRDDEDLPADERARKLAKRQRERKRRREATRELRAKLDAAEARLAALEGRTIDADKSAIQREIAAVEAAYHAAEEALAAAVETGDGKGVVAAQREVARLGGRWNELNRTKQQVERPSAPAPDPNVKRYAEDWMERNTWFNGQKPDKDSRIVLAIDAALAESKQYAPNSKEYWDALDAEVRKALPNRFRNRTDLEQTRRGPPIGGRSDRQGGKVSVKVGLTPDRIKALKDEGVWGDKVAMQPFLREFADFDRRNANKTR